MRVIKFRAYNTKSKKMVDPYKLTPFALDPKLNGELDGLFLPFNDDYKLMQFTGLLDKNGKEIYEGDILQMHWKRGVGVAGSPFVIAWDDQQARYTDYSPKDTVEVIGNIYETPELLTK